MVRSSDRYTRATSFAIVVISLVVMTAVLAALVYWLLSAATRADGERQKYLLRLASVAAAGLLLALLVLLGTVARYVARRLTAPQERFEPMGYVDAWSEAGRRLKPEDAPPVPGFEADDEEDDPDQPKGGADQ